jgi:hypothetical protein
MGLETKTLYLELEVLSAVCMSLCLFWNLVYRTVYRGYTRIYFLLTATKALD